MQLTKTIAVDASRPSFNFLSNNEPFGDVNVNDEFLWPASESFDSNQDSPLALDLYSLGFVESPENAYQQVLSPMTLCSSDVPLAWSQAPPGYAEATSSLSWPQAPGSWAETQSIGSDVWQPAASIVHQSSVGNGLPSTDCFTSDSPVKIEVPYPSYMNYDGVNLSGATQSWVVSKQQPPFASDMTQLIANQYVKTEVSAVSHIPPAPDIAGLLVPSQQYRWNFQTTSPSSNTGMA